MADRARPVPRRLTVLATLVILAVTTVGCVVGPYTLDGPLAVNLSVSTTPTSVEVDGPGWFAPTSAVYLCPTEPPALPDPGPERIGWTPGSSCHDFGTWPSRDGLKASLPLADLAPSDRPALAAAEEWVLLVLDVDGERVVTATRLRFPRPDGFSA
jgi:hypothetical protein